MHYSANERAYIQLLGRVGRYREPCQRFLWDELEDPVDILVQAKMWAELRKKTVRGPIKRAEKQVKNQSRLSFQASMAFNDNQHN